MSLLSSIQQQQIQQQQQQQQQVLLYKKSQRQKNRQHTKWWDSSSITNTNSNNNNNNRSNVCIRFLGTTKFVTLLFVNILVVVSIIINYKYHQYTSTIYQYSSYGNTKLEDSLQESLSTSITTTTTIPPPIKDNVDNRTLQKKNTFPTTVVSSDKINNNNNNNDSPKYKYTQKEKIVALIHPPGLIGGYRNEVLRFLSLLVYCQKNNITQIYLSSIYWSTQLNGIGTTVQWYPVVMSSIFDIEYYNNYSIKTQSYYNKQLPLLINELVEYDENDNENENDDDTVVSPNTVLTATGASTDVRKQPNQLQKQNYHSSNNCWIHWKDIINISLIVPYTNNYQQQQNNNNNNNIYSNNHTILYEVTLPSTIFTQDYYNTNNYNNQQLIMANEFTTETTTTTTTTTTKVIINHLQYTVLLEGGTFRPIVNYSLYNLLGMSSLSLSSLQNDTTKNKNNHQQQHVLTSTRRGPDLLPLINKQCIYPIGYGGGTKAGRLWNTYITNIVKLIQTRTSNKHQQQQKQIQKQQNNQSQNKKILLNTITDIDTDSTDFDTDIALYRALRPAKHWRDVASQCILKNLVPTTTTTTTTTKNTNSNNFNSAATSTTGTVYDDDDNDHDDDTGIRTDYIALHARIELEIMEHTCGTFMDKNLTNIIQNIHNTFLIPSSTINSTTTTTNVSGLFVAVSRDGIEDTTTDAYRKYKHYADENVRILNMLTKNRQQQQQQQPDVQTTGITVTIHPILQNVMKQLPVFECGKNMLDEYYNTNPTTSTDYGSILQSVLNFYIAVNAYIFIGVQGSSYSTDVLTTRYYLNKGQHNYYYTTNTDTNNNGIVHVPNNGLPQPHTTCSSRKTNINNNNGGSTVGKQRRRNNNKL